MYFLIVFILNVLFLCLCVYAFALSYLSSVSGFAAIWKA